MENMTEKQASELCKAFKTSRFSASGYYPKDTAQMQLQGKSHYADSDTLRFFKSRILSTYDTDHGTLFALVESVSLDMHHTSRGFRFVVFDLGGKTLGRVSIEETFKSKAKATAAMWDFLNSFDTVAHYKERLVDDIRRAERDLVVLQETLGALS